MRFKQVEEKTRKLNKDLELAKQLYDKIPTSETSAEITYLLSELAALEKYKKLKYGKERKW